VDSDPSPNRNHGSRAAAGLLAAGFAAACLFLSLPRLKRPCLYGDDVLRIIDLQTKPLSTLLFRPINEHMAPFFELVSWATWDLAGRKLVRAPLAFALTSIVPFLACLALLRRVAQRELGSITAARAAVAIFSISTVYAEVVLWYSASTFAWALMWTLIVWLCAESAVGGRSRIGVWGTVPAAALAPACSGIGLLAGPLGTIRWLSGPASPDPHRRGPQLAAIAPLLGTGLYLAICSAFRYRGVLESSLRRHADLARGLELACRAPACKLVPSLFGWHDADLDLPPLPCLAVSLVALAGILAWARRGRPRAMILGGLWLILGGYGLIYPVRTHLGTDHTVLHMERFHLFPQLGLSLILSAGLGPWLRRFDARPIAGRAVSTGLAALLLVAHLAPMRQRTWILDFPEQAPTLAALDRLGAICRANRITRDQALAALDPIRSRWHIQDWNTLELLATSVAHPGLPDDRVRPTLLAALTPAEREGLCGGLNASPLLRAAPPPAGSEVVSLGPPVGSFRIREAGSADWYLAAGWPSFLEYRVAPEVEAGRARGLILPGGAPGEERELWWTDEAGRWSGTRSIWWRLDPARPTGAVAIPLARLPHWSAARVCRIRVFFHAEGRVAAGSPRLIR
jgi:hypothetical protein